MTAAGILRDRMIFNMTEEEWDDVISVHLKGTFSVVQPAVRIFREQQSGRIIMFSSVSGLYGYSGQSNYGAAKDAIAGLARVLGNELSGRGVTANAISPGANTRMTASVPDSTRFRRAGTFPPAPEGMITRDPRRRCSDGGLVVVRRRFRRDGAGGALRRKPGQRDESPPAGEVDFQRRPMDR